MSSRPITSRPIHCFDCLWHWPNLAPTMVMPRTKKRRWSEPGQPVLLISVFRFVIGWLLLGRGFGFGTASWLRALRVEPPGPGGRAELTALCTVVSVRRPIPAAWRPLSEAWHQPSRPSHIADRRTILRGTGGRYSPLVRDPEVMHIHTHVFGAKRFARFAAASDGHW